MKTSGHTEDDDLILYAMQALSAADAKNVTASLAQSEALRQRYADVKLTLGLYAAVAVDPVDAPVESLDRLMRAVSKNHSAPQMLGWVPKFLTFPKRVAPVLHWAGWAIAALLLLTAGWQVGENRMLRNAVAIDSARLEAAHQASVDLAEERNAMEKRAQQEASRADASVAEFSTRSAELNQQLDDATSRAEGARKRAAQLSAQVSAEASRATKASAQAADLVSVAEINASERERLQGTLNRQQDQLSQLGAQAVEARQVMDALSDPTALRATLFVPKQKKTPSGRGTYVAERGTLLFAGSNLPHLHGNKVYELWLMPTNGSAPIPAGTFTPDESGNATLVSTSFRKAIAARGFAVTAEPSGGSQKPTVPILLAAL